MYSHLAVQLPQRMLILASPVYHPTTGETRRHRILERGTTQNMNRRKDSLASHSWHMSCSGSV